MSTPEQAARELAQLGRQLKAAPKELRKELLAEIRKEGKPAVEDVKASLPPSMPNRGGLADRMSAAKFGVRTRLSGRSGRVQIRVTGPKNRMRTLKTMNETGSWRHPVFGNRRTWVAQTYEPAKGWFDEPLEKDAPRFRKGIERAMSKTAQQIVRGVGS